LTHQKPSGTNHPPASTSPGGIKSEQWAASSRNAGRHHFGTPGRLHRNPHDKALVRSLAERLRRDGLKVWLDEWMLKPGNNILEKIEDGLKHSRVLVLCMSKNGVGSDWTQMEVGTFRSRDPLNKEGRFIPLRLDDVPIEGSLAQFAYIDWRLADREQEYTKLLIACRPSATPMVDGTKHAGKDAIWAPGGLTLTQEEPASAPPDRAVVIAIGLFIVAIGTGAGWLAGAGLTGAMGAPLTVLSAVIGGISGLVFWLLFERYIGVLGAGGLPSGSLAREAYDQLRAGLSGGNLASRLYVDWLTKFLDAVDRFFGDAGMADRTLFPRAFGLKTPAPLWTAPAFDRCLLLALIYPVVTIFMIWAVSGRIGPAEAALTLKSDVAGWQRALTISLAGVSVLLVRRAALTKGLKSIVWIAFAFPVGLAGAVTGSPRFDLYFTAIVALAFALAGHLDGAVAIALAVVSALDGFIAAAAALTLGRARAISRAGAIAVLGVALFSAIEIVGIARLSGIAMFSAGAIVPGLLALPVPVVVTVVIIVLNDKAIQKHRQGVFLSLYLLALAVIIMSVGPVAWLTPKFAAQVWGATGPLLMFLGLLTLINAPFDWASLGLTRALLRRGVELGGWWPYCLALADALAAAFIIALLAITMVVGVQTFDHLAEHSGGVDARILPLDKLFDGIAAHPSAPEYWWVYALLLSAMIPSLLNLMIGGASLLRGIPGLPTLLLRFMPASKAVPAFDRTWLALVLTCQVFVGAFLGIAAQFVLAIGVLFYVLPWMGLEVLDTARAVAEYDLPMKMLRSWWGDQP
jgi:hypothetical protein